MLNILGIERNKAIFVILLAIFVALFFILIISLLQQQRALSDPRTTTVGDQLVIFDAEEEWVPVLDTPVPPPPQPVIEAEPEPTPEPEPEPTPLPSPDEVIFTNYTVQPGDTLYSISRNRIDTNIALMARYGISARDIVAGRVIRLPIGNPAYCSAGRPYAVHEGDTLFSLSRRFNVGVDQLRQMNNLDENATIYVARILCVP